MVSSKPSHWPVLDRLTISEYFKGGDSPRVQVPSQDNRVDGWGYEGKVTQSDPESDNSLGDLSFRAGAMSISSEVFPESDMDSGSSCWAV